MEQLKTIVELKISIYKGLLGVAKELQQDDNITYYNSCLDKLAVIYDILSE